MKSPSTLSPLEAYEALMLFAQRRGEGALRLAMHAAVPQSFRPDLLHLLKLNFLPRELHDASTEADVLFSPLCEEVGRGYFEFGPHARTLLLDNLAANYAADRTPRIRRVANFLLHYVEQMERRAAGGLDRLWRDYLEVQRWVALAFLDPDEAARQLAAALKGSAGDGTGGEFTARLRLGGLASALASPLVRYRHVLNYAAGLQALEAGDHARARTLLSGLGDEELDVGGIRLRPATELLRAYSVPDPAEPEPPGIGAEMLHVVCTLFPGSISIFSDISSTLEKHNVNLRVTPILDPDELMRHVEVIKQADALLLILNDSRPIDIKHLNTMVREIITLSKPIIILDNANPPREWPSFYARVLLVSTLSERYLTMILFELDRIRAEKEVSKIEREAQAEGKRIKEQIKAIEALAGSDEPSVLERLTEVIWEEENARVRLAAVDALSQSRSETALEALLVAAGDRHHDVRTVAAEALAASGVNNAVLIFGFFGTDHVENREVLREELRRRGYVPLVFPYNRPAGGNQDDIARAAAPLTAFVVADLSTNAEIQLNLIHFMGAFLRRFGHRKPVLFISQEAADAIVTERLEVLRQRYPGIRPLRSYSGPGELREAFERIVIEPTTPPESAQSFRHQVFISYAAWDNGWDRETEGWVDEFRQRLQEALAAVVGYQPSIWLDQRKVDSTKQLYVGVPSNALKESAVMVCVISPSYASSQQCGRELEMFVQHAEQTGGLTVNGHPRLFPVVKEPLGEIEISGRLRETEAYILYRTPKPEVFDPSGAVSLETFGRLDATARRRLEDLARAIGQTLTELKV